MFTDIVGSTALIDQLGDAPAELARRTHMALLRAALSDANGQEVKNTGDGIMAVFASTQDAVNCAIAIEQSVARYGQHFRPALRVRVGLHVGEAIEDEGDFFGATVNIARRLCDAAAPMQILASTIVRGVLGRRGDVGFTDVGPLALKGFAEAVPACEIAWGLGDGEIRSLPAALTSRERLGFVGRRAELRALDAQWSQVESHGARLVVLAGEPGIGKSRLAKEFATLVRDQEGVVLFGRCDEEPLLPFQPFVEALREVLRGVSAPELVGLPSGTVATLARLVPDLGGGDRQEPGPDAGADRYLLFEAVRALLSRLAADAPVLFVLDDLHWADQPTLLLLAHLVMADEPTRLLVVGTYRDTESSTALGGCLADLRSGDRLTTLSVRGLAVEDVAGLLEASVGREMGGLPDDLPEIIRLRTEGNPLFVRELLREAVDGDPSVLLDDGSTVPEGLRAIIRRRLSRLSTQTREVLTAASVVGSHFDIETVARTCELQRFEVLDALDEAQASREVVDAPGELGRFAFSHELVRRSLYAELPRGRRAELHRRVAEAIERLRGDDPSHLAALAHHYTEGAAAGVADKAVRYAGLAGAQAIQTFAYEEAVAQYERALAAGSQCDPDPARTAGLLIGLGRARSYTSDVPGARAAYRHAATEARLAGSADQLAAAALGFGQRGPGVGRVDTELLDLLREAVEVVGDSNLSVRAQVMARLAREVYGGGNRQEAERLSSEALVAARASADPTALAIALNAQRQSLLGVQHLHRRLEIDQETLEIAESTGNRELAMTAWAGLVIDQLRLGDISAVDASLEALTALISRVRHNPRFDWHLATYRAMRALFAGDLDGAEQFADEALSIGARTDNPDAQLVHAAQISTIRREQGRLGELGPIIDAFAAEESSLLAWSLLRAHVFIENSDIDGARHVVASIDPQEFRELPRDDFWLLHCSLAAEAVACVDDRERAAVLYDLLQPVAGYNVVLGGGTVATGSTNRYLGLLASCLGRTVEAAEHFEAACRHNDDMGAVIAAIRTRVDWAASYAAQGATDDAARLAAEALSIARAEGLEGLGGLAGRIAALA